MHSASTHGQEYGGSHMSATSLNIHMANTPNDRSVYYSHDPLPAQYHTPYADTAFGSEQQGRGHQDLMMPTSHPRGAGVEGPRDYDSPPVTGSTTTLTSGDLYSKPSQQHLLVDPCRRLADETTSSGMLRSPPSAYSPPAQPAAHCSAGAGRVLRDKSVSDRYDKRRAGGDSGMGECCECCCGGCMRCACCSAICCMGPIVTTVVVVLVLIGVALALYFNWDKITRPSHKADSSAPGNAAATTRALAHHVAMSIGGRVGAHTQAALERV